jgi:hypothetical protein
MEEGRGGKEHLLAGFQCYTLPKGDEDDVAIYAFGDTTFKHVSGAPCSA